MTANQRLMFVVLVAVQMGVLGAMIGERLHLLATGTVVRLTCRPVDPRSLLSGDYVELNYRAADVHRLKRIKPAGRDDDDNPVETFHDGETVYVAVEKAEIDDVWEAVACGRNRNRLEGPGRVVLRGRVSDHGSRVHYGIEQYFVPQFEGLRIERNMADVTVDVAVGPTGQCALKRLYIADTEVTFY